MNEMIERLMRGVEAARVLLAQHIRPGPSSAVDTVERLIDGLDDREFVATLERLNRRRVIRLVE
ncbi:hypothetical protein AB8A28_14070 [Tardiphaga sp. 71_E8_N1_1]|uniref:hypothetical protein n=1 Tax=Tardiphaga sp. 71_E8_N1_1 TaxID=3240784 RepID=UPI003F8C88D2